MNIGTASALSGLPVKTIRYYEEIQLVQPARSSNGYRHYSDRDIHCLRFLQRSRSLGFSIDECRELLSLYHDDDRASADVRAIALGKIDELDRKLQELHALKATLEELVSACQGDGSPHCPIIEDLAGADRLDQKATPCRVK